MNTAHQQRALRRSVVEALDVARKVLSFLDDVELARSASIRETLSPDKALAETCMLLYVASGHADPTIQDKVWELSVKAAEQARSKRLMASVAMDPKRASSVLVAHEILSRLGLQDPRADKLIAASLDAVAGTSRDLRTVERLEQGWCKDAGHAWAASLSALPDWEQGLAASQLSRVTEVLSATRDEMYFYTHEMFYISDFGHRPERVRDDVKRTVEVVASAMLAKSIEASDYDLAAELLLSWPMCGLRWSAGAEFAWRLLRHVEDSLGILPGGTTDVAHFESLQGREREQYAVGSSYHTVYVGAMLSCCLLTYDRGDWSQTAVVCKAEASRFARELGGSIQAVFEAAPAESRARFGGFLLDVSLSRAAREQRIPDLAALVALAETGAGEDSLLGRQAGALLQRLGLWLQLYPEDDARGGEATAERSET